MRYDYDTQRQNRTLSTWVKILWIIAVVFLGALIISVLESEVMLHGGQASDWYISALNSISVTTV